MKAINNIFPSDSKDSHNNDSNNDDDRLCCKSETSLSVCGYGVISPPRGLKGSK